MTKNEVTTKCQALRTKAYANLYGAALRDMLAKIDILERETIAALERVSNV